MIIDRDAADFPYVQLADQIRGRINRGEYAPGSKLPTIIDLIGETGLTTETIRRAMGVLAEEGLVRIVPGRGTFVR